MPNLFEGRGHPVAHGLRGRVRAGQCGLDIRSPGVCSGEQSFGLSWRPQAFRACTVGVIYINIMKRQGKIDPSVLEPAARPVTVADFQSHNEIPISESVDRLSVQFSLVIIVYLAPTLFPGGITALLAGILARPERDTVIFGVGALTSLSAPCWPLSAAIFCLFNPDRA